MARARQPVVVDTGPLIAVLDVDDADHEACTVWLETAIYTQTQLLIPVPVITEVCYSLDKIGGRHKGPELEARFLESLAVEEHFVLCSLDRTQLQRMADLARHYRALRLGAADLSVMVIAERYNTTTIATLDHRDFLAVTPSHGNGHYTLLP